MAAAEHPGAAQSGLPRELVFVDLETTGGNAAFHRITEVGIVRMRDDVIVEEWSSLVNPGCRIPPYIAAFTGITDEMVAGAPRFPDLAALVLEKLRPSTGEPPLFVAHNARFDYSFLRTEFRRLEVNFSARVLCTVKLSRRLFPQHPRHSLDALMERHRLSCTARHRALGDARVLGEFWSTLRREIPPDALAAAARIVIGANRLPGHLPAGLADELPEGPGVYRFFGEGDALLYVGRSHSLRTRILGHFAAENSDPKDQKKAARTRRIDWMETAGVLGAQLQEAEWIKTQKPLFNKRLKPGSQSCTLRPSGRAPGVVVSAMADLAPADLDGCYGVFQSPRDARKALTDIARAHRLCMKILGLEAADERREGSCAGYPIGSCRGACIGEEPLMLHEVRLRTALTALKLKPWPFPGRIAIAEGHAEFLVLDHWVYLGTARSEHELEELRTRRTAESFDADVYRILLKFLAKNPAISWHELNPPRSPAAACCA